MIKFLTILANVYERDFSLFEKNYPVWRGTQLKAVRTFLGRLFEYPIFKIRPAYNGAVIVGLIFRSRGRHVIHVKPPPLECRAFKNLAKARGLCERFTFYFHAILTSIYATFLTYRQILLSCTCDPCQFPLSDQCAKKLKTQKKGFFLITKFLFSRKKKHPFLSIKKEGAGNRVK